MVDKIKLKVGDIVVLNGNPFDEQLGEYGTAEKQEIKEIKDTSKTKGTSGQWIKTCFYKKDWIDASWFDRIYELTLNENDKRFLLMNIQQTFMDKKNIKAQKKIIKQLGGL